MPTQKSVFKLLEGEQVVPVVVVENQNQALGLAGALQEGGINSIEITLRHAYGIKAIEQVKKNYPDMIVIAGTVNNEKDLLDVISAGADVVVSPGATPGLLATAAEKGIPYLPGVATPSEILTAMSYGFRECKLFPASVVGGVGALKAYSSPLSEVDFCPTGGINEANYKEYLALDNVKCVGGSWVAPGKMIAEQNWAEITRLCKNLAL